MVQIRSHSAGYVEEKIRVSEYKLLSKVGLSPLAIRCYGELYAGGTDTAGNLAQKIGNARTSVYHALAKLEKFGFVERNKVEIFHQVTRFKAVRLDKALENLAIYQRRSLQNLIDYQIEKSIYRESAQYSAHTKRDWR